MDRPAARLFVALLTGPQRYAVGLSMPVLMICSMWGSAQFPQQTWICIAPILFCFAILPLLDWVIGRDMVQDDASYAKGLQEQLAEHRAYMLLLWGHILLHIATLVIMLWLVSRSAFSGNQICGLSLSMGVCAAFACNSGHELAHGRKRLDRAVGSVMFLITGYGHFWAAHATHHAKVATHEDPNRPDLNDSLYVYMPKAAFRELKAAYAAEVRKTKAKGTGLISKHNRTLMLWLGYGILASSLTITLGRTALLLMTCQQLTVIAFTQIMSYVLHYGLVRQRDPSGRYKKLTAADAWEDDHIITDAFLLNLARHSWHHLAPMQPYQVLQMTSGPAKLPYSAATMFLLAFVPPLYFRVMHPCIERVLAHTHVRQAEEEEQGVPASSAIGMQQMQCAQHGALKLRTQSIKWEQMELQSG